MESRRGNEGQPVPDRLAVRTVPVADPGGLVGRLPGPAALAWVRHGEGLVGWGEAARITLPAGEDRFTAGEKWLRELFDRATIEDQVAMPGSGPVAFGSFTFDSTCDGSVLVVPGAVLGRRSGQTWLTTIGDPADSLCPARPLTPPSEVRWHDGSLPAPDWERAVATAVSRIRSGRLGKVVLARDLYATASEDIDVRVLLHRLAERYPDCYTFACAGLVGATPELLIRRQDDDISSLVLAGTIPRGRDAEEDRALGASLLVLGQGDRGARVRGRGGARHARAAVRRADGGRPALAPAPGQRAAPRHRHQRQAGPGRAGRRPFGAVAGRRRCTPPGPCAAPRPRWPWS